MVMSLPIYKNQRAPWKTSVVTDEDTAEMWHRLGAISEAKRFGVLLPITARDILAAARLADPDAKPSDVQEFCRYKASSNKGLREWGGILKSAYEEFGAWRSEKKRLAQDVCPFCKCSAFNRYGQCAACGQTREVAAHRAERRHRGQDDRN
jgi:hypothetical protein